MPTMIRRSAALAIVALLANAGTALAKPAKIDYTGATTSNYTCDGGVIPQGRPAGSATADFVLNQVTIRVRDVDPNVNYVVYEVYNTTTTTCQTNPLVGPVQTDSRGNGSATLSFFNPPGLTGFNLWLSHTCGFCNDPSNLASTEMTP
jgi:hypothetical protein